MTTMPEAYAAKQALLAELCRPLLLDLTSNGASQPLYLRQDFQFAPLPDAPGFELARLLAPLGHSATLMRGSAGAHSPVFSAPQSVRVEILAGRLRWWQESFGGQDCNDAYRVVGKGDVLLLSPNEPHTYRALSPCLTYNLFNPDMPECPAQ